MLTPSVAEPDVPEFPAEMTAAVPDSLAFCTAASSGSSKVWLPESDPKDMLRTSAPIFAESSMAETKVADPVVAEVSELVKTFIASSCASGATPTTDLAGSSPVPLAPMIPATCMPCCSSTVSSVIVSLLSA